MFLLIFTATFISGIISLFGALLLAKKGNWETTFSLQLTAFAAGVMLSTSLLHLLPEAFEEFGEADLLFYAVFVGVVLFFLMERMVLWFHHHHEHHELKPSVWLITFGDSFHNLVDGVAISSAFLVDIKLGIITTLAVGLHEIPQEIADFVTMIRGGLSVKRALLFNFLSALSSLVGAVLTYFSRDLVEPIIPLIVAFSAGMFLYIALSDLIPDLHEHTKKNTQKWIQLLWFFSGILLMLFVTTTVELFLAH